MKHYSALFSLACVLSLAACGGHTPPATSDAPMAGWQVLTTGKAGAADNLCYTVSAPVKLTGSVKGKRFTPYLMATRRNSGKIEISASSGYVYPEGGKVELAAGDKRYAMKFKGSVAWMLTDAQDKAVTAYLEKGGDVDVRGVSEHRAAVIESYEAEGFADAIAQVRTLCP